MSRNKCHDLSGNEPGDDSNNFFCKIYYATDIVILGSIFQGWMGKFFHPFAPSIAIERKAEGIQHLLQKASLQRS